VHNLTGNDGADCPEYFMSFGQSAIALPRKEIEAILRDRLATRAVQQWIDKNADTHLDPTNEQKEAAGAPKEGNDDVVISLDQHANSQEVIDLVRNYLVREFIPGNNLKPGDVLSAITTEENERLTDVPYGRRESVKQKWTVQEWPYDKYLGELTAEWSNWRSDFLDEGGTPMSWGPEIRKLEANRARADAAYRKRIRDKVLALFEDTSKHGPAFALCAARQLRGALGQMKEKLLRDANDPVIIANNLGDVYIINQAAHAGGASLSSSIIEPRIGEELGYLKKAVDGLNPIGKRAAVNKRAYQYLAFCCHWCRARIEERSRRLAVELLNSLDSALQDLDRELSEHARVLASVQTGLLRHLRELYQKAGREEVIGESLYSPKLLGILEKKVMERQGDKYNAIAVAQAALQRLGKTIRDIKKEEIPQFITELVNEAAKAIGSLDESTLNDTQFAAYDLLAAQYSDDRMLEQVLAQTIAKSEPFIKLDFTMCGDTYQVGSLRNSYGIAIHGGMVEHDPDPERARINSCIKHVWSQPVLSVADTRDSSQIIFFQECGNFPLRAIPGMVEWKSLYDQQRADANHPPLHIMKDETAELLPDVFPQGEKVAEALTLKSAGICLGVIVIRDFQHGRETVQLYSFSERSEITGKITPIRIGPSEESIVMKLVSNEELARKVDQALAQLIQSASPEQKAEYAVKLVRHLDDFQAEVAKHLPPQVEPATAPEVQAESKRIESFMQKHGLRISAVTAQG
jgi:hypothetical protein